MVRPLVPEWAVQHFSFAPPLTDAGVRSLGAGHQNGGRSLPSSLAFGRHRVMKAPRWPLNELPMSRWLSTYLRIVKCSDCGLELRPPATAVIVTTWVPAPSLCRIESRPAKVILFRPLRAANVR